MNEESEPLELNLYQQYRHAVKVDRSSSRMNNRDWYRKASSLNVQLHCYMMDEGEMDCYLHIQSQSYFAQIGRLSLQDLSEEAQVGQFVQEMLQLEAVKSAKAESLGIVFYMANEVSMAGLGPEHSDPDELMYLARLVGENPKEVLEDKTVSQEAYAWRMFPYAGGHQGGEFATVVAVPRTLDPLLRALRQVGNDSNFPIVTCAFSAPLCAVASLPWCVAANPQGTIAIFTYSHFTLLSFFNDQCELMMLRHIAHAPGAKTPRNLGPSVFSSATAFELESPEIYIFPMAGENVDAVVLSLQTAMKQSSIMLVDSRDILRSRGIELDIPLEMMTVCHDFDAAIYPLAGNDTFSGFKDGAWPFQDFLSPSHEELQSIPDAAAMTHLKWSRIAKLVASLLLVAVMVHVGLAVIKQLSSSVASSKAPTGKTKLLADLQKKLEQRKQWDERLRDRSKGWVNMELMSMFSPADESIQLTNVSYNCNTTALQKKAKTLGLVKNWTISGYSNEKGLLWLEDFNTTDAKKIRTLFQELADKTGNQAFEPDEDTRYMSVNLTHKLKGGGGRRASSEKNIRPGMTHSFTLKVTQNFSSEDVLSLTQPAKAKKKRK